MSLINLLVIILLTLLILGGINAFIPMAPLIKRLLNFLVLIIIVLYILQFFHLIKQVLPLPHLS
tara:strand:+ start:6000 stop:6191 length:192 start_codon:yes stop_codon:yes gene_type:complete